MQDQINFYKAKVINVVDGDTIDCLIDLGFNVSIKQRLRLSGIDTPERKEEGFSEAKEFLHGKIMNQNIVVKIEGRSKWGYYLASLFDLNGFNINEEILRLGLAVEYHGGTKG